MLRWLESASLPLSALDDEEHVERALTALARPTSIRYGIRKITSEMASQAMACATACDAAATLSGPTIAHAVNSTRSNLRSTSRGWDFSCATRLPWAG